MEKDSTNIQRIDPNSENQMHSFEIAQPDVKGEFMDNNRDAAQTAQ